MNHWQNWSGSVSANPAIIRDDLTVDMLADIINSAPGPIRPFGSAHSFTALCQAQGGTLVSLQASNPLVETGNGFACINAGARLGDITAALHENGQALLNMGDIDSQTLAGALATATHGTGMTFTCYPAMLSGFTLVDGRGEERIINRLKQPDLFRAMAVGLGTGGIVTEAVIGTTEPYRLERSRHVMSIGDLLDDFDARMSACRNVEFFYVTGSGRALILESDTGSLELKARPPDRDQEGLRQLRLVARLCRFFPRLRKWLLGMALRSHSREHFVEDWHKAYPSDRDGIRFNECEYHLPAECAPEAIRQVINLVESRFPDVYFPLEIRTVKGDDLFLSPFYNRDSVSIAVHHEAGKPFAAMVEAVERVFAKYDGRPHWGKMHNLSAAELKPLYPHWDEAVEVRRDLDPDGRFVSPYIARLLGL